MRRFRLFFFFFLWVVLYPQLTQAAMIIVGLSSVNIAFLPVLCVSGERFF